MRVRKVHVLASVVVVVLFLWSIPSEPAHALEPRPLLRKDAVYGLHNSYTRASSVFGSLANPSFEEQYAIGYRLFEIDLYWMWDRWVVAHVPWLNQQSHVSTLREALCNLAVLAREPTYVMLDVKTHLMRCTWTAVLDMAASMRDCYNLNLAVLMDISCDKYNNVECARRLNSTDTGIPVLYRGPDWHWKAPAFNCAPGKWRTKDTCLNESDHPRVALVECSWCPHTPSCEEYTAGANTQVFIQRAHY